MSHPVLTKHHDSWERDALKRQFVQDLSISTTVCGSMREPIVRELHWLVDEEGRVLPFNDTGICSVRLRQNRLNVGYTNYMRAMPLSKLIVSKTQGTCVPCLDQTVLIRILNHG